MKIFVSREIKLLFFGLTTIFLTFIALEQITIKFVADDYKQTMIEHDYTVAGYLRKNGFDQSQIVRAFTTDKTSDETKVGSDLLRVEGYTINTQNTLLPPIQHFYQKYSIILLVSSTLFSLTLLALLLLFLLRQDKKIEKANRAIQAFLDGDIHIRLDDREEGSLSQLFTLVNGMATSLTAHILNEKHGREFLKDTISDISHQLKTPLSALEMYNEIIQNEQTENEVVNEFASKSERELTRMETLIQSLLKLAKLDTGYIELEKRPHNVKLFLEEVIMGMRTRAELENKFIQLNCSEHVELSFDEAWLLEAVSNIIKNALDHTDEHCTIHIRCEETPIVTEIIIKDNGMGIHPEDIHSIFKRFYRSRFSKDQHGLGIGLTLSKMIIEKHNGSITVESELGKGTVFSLAFPKLSNS